VALKSRCQEQKEKMKNTCCQIPLPMQMCSGAAKSKHVSSVDNSCPLKSPFVILIFFYFNDLLPHCYKFPGQPFPPVLHVNPVCAFVENQLNTPWVRAKACCRAGAAEGQALLPARAAARPAVGRELPWPGRHSSTKAHAASGSSP